MTPIRRWTIQPSLYWHLRKYIVSDCRLFHPLHCRGKWALAFQKNIRIGLKSPAPADQTVVCRCEEVTAGQIRTMAKIGRPGPNQIKAATRVGMGPCQGRQCGYTVNRLISAVQQRSPSDVGFYHIRPPLKPVTLGELASLHKATS